MKRPFAVAVASWSLLAVPVALLVLLAILTIVGGRSPAGVTRMLTIASVVAIVLALGLRWTNRFLIPALVVSVPLALFALVTQAETGLVHPESFFDFATALITLVGPLTAAVACAAALVQRRRGTLGPSTRHQRRLVGTLAALVVIVVAASGVKGASVEPASVRAPSAAAVVEARVDRWVPSTIRSDGRRVRAYVVNRDSFAHTFTIDALDLDEYIGPYARRLITFRVPEDRRRLELYCYVTGHEGMTGQIVVR